jgi:hypothetical protein
MLRTGRYVFQQSRRAAQATLRNIHLAQLQLDSCKHEGSPRGSFGFAGRGICRGRTLERGNRSE